MDVNTVFLLVWICLAIYAFIVIVSSIGAFVVSALQKQPIAVEVKAKPKRKPRGKRV